MVGAHRIGAGPAIALLLMGAILGAAWTGAAFVLFLHWT